MIGRRRRIALLLDADNNYYVELVKAFAAYGRLHGGWDVLAMSYGDVRLGDVAAGRVDGALVESVISIRPYIGFLRVWGRHPIPTVDVSSDDPAEVPGVRAAMRRNPMSRFPRVSPDHMEVGRRVARHLLERGFKRFAFLGLPLRFSQQRFEGFREVVAAAGCDVTRFDDRHSWFPLSQSRWDRAQVPPWVVSLPPHTALFVCSDTRCREIAGICRQIGRAVPEDIALVGVDDHPVCEVTTPALSTVSLDADRIGRVAGQIMARLLRGESVDHSPVLVAPGEVIVRGSSDIYAVEDPLVSEALRYITQNVHVGIRVQDVASHAGVASRTLEVHFRKALGWTVQKELAARRIERVKSLLAETDMPIHQIARVCGFAQLERLSVAFRRATGMTATAYRQARGVSEPSAG